MKMHNLKQKVQLDPGQPDLVHNALHIVLHELMQRDPSKKRLSTTEALSLKPLTKLMLRVLKLAIRDDWPEILRCKQHRFTVEYDELTVLRYYYARLLATTDDPDHQNLLATALGKFHQCSLNVETHIALPSPTGPGCQLPMPV